MTTKKAPEKSMPVVREEVHFIHLPYAYPISKKRFYGLTAALLPRVVFNSETKGPVVAFKAGLSFCSPSEPKGYKSRKGEQQAMKRLMGKKGRTLDLMVPLSDIMRGRLEKELLKMIDMVLGPQLLPEGLMGLAEDYGFPTRLMCYRHAHQGDKR